MEIVCEEAVDRAVSVSHAHWGCVEGLQEELIKLKEKLRLFTEPRAFSVALFLEDDRKFCYYTGFSTPSLFHTCFEYLQPSAEVIRTWQGAKTKGGDRTTDKPGKKSKLPLLEILW